MKTDIGIWGENQIAPGHRKRLRLEIGRSFSGANVTLPLMVWRGPEEGPVVGITAAVHGDEINGSGAIRRLIQEPPFTLKNGTLILVPVVNIMGFERHSRYMPDRRDLNRCFPGSEKGSLAARVADIFLCEIVQHCDYGIDLHTGAIHRSNLPQIRANLNDPETLTLAETFGVPVLLNADLRDGSLRQAAVETGARILLYEAGQALRFDELSIRAGLRGVLNVLGHLKMIRQRPRRRTVTPFVANQSAWNRATASGIVRDLKVLGDQVVKGEALATIGNPFGEVIDEVLAVRSGIVIGKQNIPLVQEGDAMYHIAYFSEPDEEVAMHIETLQESLTDDEHWPPDSMNR